MAANSIGNASLKLSSDATSLVSGLASTGSAVKKWSDSVQTNIANAFKSTASKVSNFLGNAKSILGGAGTALGTAIGGPLGGAIGGAIGSAAGSIVETIWDAVTSPFAKLDVFAKINKQAATLGVSASQLQGLGLQMARVGIEGDAVGQTFALMGKNVADAAGGHGRAAPAFKQLGIDAKALLALPLDEQFKAIADAVNRLPPGAEQASAAMHIFGGQGAALLPILQKGGAGIQAFIEQQRKVGAVLSDSQLKAAADASKAWKESSALIKSVWDGLVNRATLIAAPIIKFVGGAVTKAFTLLTPVFEWLGRAIDKTSFILTSMFDVFAGWVDVAIGWLKNLAGSVGAFGAEWPTVESVVVAVFKAVGMAAGYVWDTLKAGSGAIAFVTSYIVEGFAKIVDVFKETIKSLLGLAGKLPDSLGGKMFRDMIPGVDAWAGNIRTAAGDMRAFGRNAFSSWGESATRIGQWFDTLSERRATEEAAARRVQEAISKPPDYKGIAAMERGSKEAYSIEQKFAWDSQFTKKPEEQAVEQLKKANQKLAEVLTQLGRGPLLRAG